MTQLSDILKPGDHLLYGAREWYDFIVAFKTWSPAVHIEIYNGLGMSLASRHGIGVNMYPLREADLITILRPKKIGTLPNAARWFAEFARGQGYDWKGLLCFMLAVKQGSPDKMFCSEFACQFDRAAVIDSFAPDFPADKVAPGSFLMSPAFEKVPLP